MKKNNIVKIIGAIVLFVAVIVGVLLVLRKNDSGDIKEAVSKPTEAPSEAVTPTSKPTITPTTAPTATPTPTTPPPKPAVDMKIDAKKEVYSFSPEMLGTNIGIWTNATFYPKAKPKLVNMIKEAGIKMLRFPAGAEADDTYFDRENKYAWTIGPQPYTRTMRADYLDAFIDLCKQTGAEPLIIVNAKHDNPEMAADIVRYCNVDHDYNVKYFEIGNEPQYWQTLNGIQYAERLAIYADAMKAVDPDIIIANAGPAQPVSINDWLAPVLMNSGNKINAVNLHWYPLYDGVKDPNHAQYHKIENLLKFDYGPEAIIWNQIASIAFVDRFVKTNPDSLVNLRNQYAPKAKIGLTEVSPVAGGNSESGVSDTLANALWFGDILGRMAYNGVDFVTQFLLISSPQKYAMADMGYKVRPVWYTFVMYHRYFGDTMVKSTNSDSTDLTMWASTKKGVKDKLYVMVVNRNTTTPCISNMKFSNFIPTSGKSWELNSSAAGALTANINGISYGEDITLPEIPGKAVNQVGADFTYTFPAHSITTFEFTGTFQ